MNCIIGKLAKNRRFFDKLTDGLLLPAFVMLIPPGTSLPRDGFN